MKYKVIMKGEFTNIQYIVLEQTFGVRLKCTSCMKVSDKIMILTYESIKRGSGPGVYNFICDCTGCDKQLRANITHPLLKKIMLNTTQEGDEIDREPKEETYCLSEMEGQDFPVSTIETVGCNLIYLEAYSFFVIDNKNYIYRNGTFKYSDWTGSFKDTDFSSAVGYKIIYELSK